MEQIAIEKISFSYHFSFLPNGEVFLQQAVPTMSHDQMGLSVLQWRFSCQACLVALV
jgi:hypothetical protein